MKSWNQSKGKNRVDLTLEKQNKNRNVSRTENKNFVFMETRRAESKTLKANPQKRREDDAVRDSTV